MSQVGQVGGQDQNFIPVQRQQTAKTDEQAVAEPKDKVEISKGRDIAEKVLGAPVAVVTSVANAAGGIFTGGVSAVERKSEEDVQSFSSGLAYIGMGIAAGVALGTGWVLPVVGGIVGLGMGILAAGSGSSEKIGERVGEAAAQVASDNEPSGRKLKDAARDFTEGGITGMGVGLVEGFKEGDAYGAGIVSGLVEGTKGVVTSALGKYETPGEAPADGVKPEKKGIFKTLLGIPRAVLGTAAGVVMGGVGMAMEAPDGAIQGTIVGAADGNTERRFHGFMVRAETAIAGTVAGFMFGGPWGAAIGLGTGLVTGQIIRRAERKSGSDRDMMKNLNDAVQYAQKDNAYQGETNQFGKIDKTPYETFRDGVEGTMTGTAAGAREGFKQGFSAGKGMVDGVFDAVSGIVGGITGK